MWDGIGGSGLHIFGFLCWCVDMVLASCKDGHVGDCIGIGENMSNGDFLYVVEGFVGLI